MQSGSAFGELTTVSGERIEVIRGSGDLQLVITWPDHEERLRFTMEEAHQLVTLLNEATTTEQQLVDNTGQGG